MITRTLILSAIMTIFLLALVGCQVNEQAATPSEVGASATAMMASADGSPMGTVTLTQGQNGVLVSVDLAGLSPGWHGFHIHSVGSCSPDFSAAGGHLTVEGQGHGFMQGEFHTGDMPNIHAAGDGTVRADVFNNQSVIQRGSRQSHIRRRRFGDNRPRQARLLRRRPCRRRPRGVRGD